MPQAEPSILRPRRRHSPAALLACAVLLVLLGGLLILPIALAIGSAFWREGELSLFWLRMAIADPRLIRQFANGVALASVTTGLCLVLSVPLAALRARFRFRGQNVLGVAVLLPLILPPFVGALAMRQLLGQFGTLNLLLEKLGFLEIGPGALPPDWLESGFWGVVILQTLHLFPILYLNASAALANIDPAYSQAARNLGAGPVRTFFKVTLPLMRPGLFAGGTLVFIWSFTDIGTPLILHYRELLPVTIFHELTGGEYSGLTFSLVFILLIASVLLYVVGKFVFGRSLAVQGSKGTVQAETRKLGLFGTLLAWGAFGFVLLLAILPHIGVILQALSDRWFNTLLPSAYTLDNLKGVVTDKDTYTSILNSLQYAGSSTCVDLLFGAVAAWLIVRTRVPGRGLLDGLVMLPLAVPGIILAAGYVAMTATGPLARIGPNGDPFAILVIAYSVRRLPFVVRGVSAGLEQVPESLEEAARNLGAPKGRTFRRVTLPLILANLIAAGVLTFAFAMLEVSDSLILAQRPGDYPITKQIYVLAGGGQRQSLELAAALGVYGMVLLGGTMALASLLLGKKLGAIFRA